jgi:hypothetical protein
MVGGIVGALGSTGATIAFVPLTSYASERGRVMVCRATVMLAL